ncbi:MAG TPA: hypothetical protein VHR88_10085 [Solirubrobacteraceae bacterium]|jgi:hypothetical protein|nr:hypothetical protein [Solirubrobacteraceae bacterium]
MRLDLQDTRFEGVSRSFTYLPAMIHYPSCPRCSTSLAGRYESTTTRAIGGITYIVDRFRCGCGRGKEVRRLA